MKYAAFQLLIAGVGSLPVRGAWIEIKGEGKPLGQIIQLVNAIGQLLHLIHELSVTVHLKDRAAQMVVGIVLITLVS